MSSESATREQVLRYLPEILDIANTERREAVLGIWVRLLEQSDFEDLASVPVTATFTYSHVVHNRSVVHMAMAIADILEKFHGVEIDRDDLLTVALLQDASKLVEFERDGEAYRMSQIGARLQHGFYGAHAALEAGLPVKIAQGILEHTFNGPRFPEDLITRILFYVDQIDMAALKGDRWKKQSYITR